MVYQKSHMITVEALMNLNMPQFTTKIQQTMCLLQIRNADWPLLTMATNFCPLQDSSPTRKPTFLFPQHHPTQSTHACTCFTQRIRTKRFWTHRQEEGEGSPVRPCHLSSQVVHHSVSIPGYSE